MNMTWHGKGLGMAYVSNTSIGKICNADISIKEEEEQIPIFLLVTLVSRT